MQDLATLSVAHRLNAAALQRLPADATAITLAEWQHLLRDAVEHPSRFQGVLDDSNNYLI